MEPEKVDARAFIEYLRVKWQGRPCQMCGQGDWTVQDTVFELRHFYRGGLVVGGRVVPVVPVVCTNCGNTVLVNAIVAGTVKPEAEPQKSEAKP